MEGSPLLLEIASKWVVSSSMSQPWKVSLFNETPCDFSDCSWSRILAAYKGLVFFLFPFVRGYVSWLPCLTYLYTAGKSARAMWGWRVTEFWRTYNNDIIHFKSESNHSLFEFKGFSRRGWNIVLKILLETPCSWGVVMILSLTFMKSSGIGIFSFEDFKGSCLNSINNLCHFAEVQELKAPCEKLFNKSVRMGWN